jgi:hypothetical protein
MIRSTTALLMLGVSMATATTALAQDGCFYGSCNPEASWCRLLCGKTVESLVNQTDALVDKLGPEYSKMIEGLEEADLTSSEGKELMSMLSQR